MRIFLKSALAESICSWLSNWICLRRERERGIEAGQKAVGPNQSSALQASTVQWFPLITFVQGEDSPNAARNWWMLTVIWPPG